MDPRLNNVVRLLSWSVTIMAGAAYASAYVPAAMEEDTVTIRLQPQRCELWLSDTVEVELLVEGPAPLRVESPQQWLSVASQREWGLTPLGVSRQEKCGPQRECWRQRFLLEPFVPGPVQVVSFAHLRVNGRDYPGPVLEAVVRSRVDLQDSRIGPLADWPQQTAEGERPDRSDGRLRLAFAWLALLGAAGALWQSRRRAKQQTPRQWLLQSWTMWQGGQALPVQTEPTAVQRARATAAMLADTLRQYIARRWKLPAQSWTTAELLAAAARTGWTVEQTDALERLLHQCDRWRFAAAGMNESAGDLLDAAALLDAARAWLDTVDPPEIGVVAGASADDRCRLGSSSKSDTSTPFEGPTEHRCP